MILLQRISLFGYIHRGECECCVTMEKETEKKRQGWKRKKTIGRNIGNDLKTAWERTRNGKKTGSIFVDKMKSNSEAYT